MNDFNGKLISRAIVGSAYLIAATIMFVGIGVTFVGNGTMTNSGQLFVGGIFLAMVFFYVCGLKTLTAVSRDSAR